MGYGFDLGSTVSCIDRGGDALRGDFCLARYLAPGVPAFDPARPEPVEGWSLPVRPPALTFAVPLGR